MSKSKNPPAAGANYKVESSVAWVKKGHHDTGTARNEGLVHTGFFHDEDGYDTVPEYTEEILGTGFGGEGGRTQIKVEVPASKKNAYQVPKFTAARPDSSPDWEFSNSTSGPTHPKSKPETAKPGSAPRHPDHKPVTSLPDGGPRQSRTKDGKLKDSTDTAESMAWGKNYGNRSKVSGPTIRKRSDVVPQDSSLTHDNNNPKKRTGAYDGQGRESLKDAKKLKK